MNDDEDDLEDDGNETVEKHEPDSEPLREVENLCYALISEFEQFLDHSTYKDSETEYLLKESKELEHPPHETHILRIALVGDAGQGKSSLLNSVLGHANLAIHVSYSSLLHLYVFANFSRLPTEIALLMSLWNTPRQPLAKGRLGRVSLTSSMSRHGQNSA